MNKSRRNFIFGNFRKVVDRSAEIINKKDFLLRPPGAMMEKSFQKLCASDCFECLKVCSYDIIFKSESATKSDQSFAYIDPKKGGCEYCKGFPCIEACKTGALASKSKIMGKAELLPSCITKQHQICDMCRYVCPDGHQALVRDKYGRLRVDKEICVGCGKCVDACFMVPKAVEIFPYIRQKNKDENSIEATS